MEVTFDNNGVHLTDCPCTDIGLIFDCGQAFRFNKNERGNWQGVAFGKVLEIAQDDNEILLINQTKSDYNDIWKDYFDFDRDYDEVLKLFDGDNLLEKSKKENYGIRVLKQAPWETLCSFIISQNNNIPRIKGIIERLCENFGEYIDDVYYCFPTAEKIAELEPEDLAPIRAGFRNKYIIDAARKVASKEVDLTAIYDMTLDEGENTLIRIKGVGKKVAQCVLLFAYGKAEAFPIDVWVKRVMTLYPQGLPVGVEKVKGIAQQYLFHYIRLHPEITENI
jgi:N-glycosylase/DNA lyase